MKTQGFAGVYPLYGTLLRYPSATRHAAGTDSASGAALGLGALVAMSTPSAASSVSAASQPTESTDHRRLVAAFAKCLRFRSASSCNDVES